MPSATYFRPHHRLFHDVLHKVAPTMAPARNPQRVVKKTLTVYDHASKVSQVSTRAPGKERLQYIGHFCCTQFHPAVGANAPDLGDEVGHGFERITGHEVACPQQRHRFCNGVQVAVH